MRHPALGVILATLAVYVWGTLYWGFSPLPYSAWKQTPDDAAAGRALLEHFPEEGTYHVPGRQHDPESLTRLYEAGPVALVHLTSREGRPVFDGAAMGKGFVLVLVSVGLLSLLLRQAAPALGSYGARVGFVVLAGLVAAVFLDIGDTVWWFLSVEWQLYRALYTVSAALVAGLVLAAFPPRAPA